MMGVRVRMTRNTSAYFPFWIAIPAYTVIGTVWLAIMVVVAIIWVLAKIVSLAVTAGTHRR